MPIINVQTLKLVQEKKDLMAAGIYKAASSILGIPSIDIYFNEYTGNYISGKRTEKGNEVVNITIEGPVIETEKRAELCKAVNDAVHAVMAGTNFKVDIITYHANANDHVAINGKFIGELDKN